MKKKPIKKYQDAGQKNSPKPMGIFGRYVQKRKVTDEEGNSITEREIKNPISGIMTKATIVRTADGDKRKSTVRESYRQKKGGTTKSKSKKK